MSNESENWFPDTPEGRGNRALWNSLKALRSEGSIVFLRQNLQSHGMQEREIERNIAAAIVYRVLVEVLQNHLVIGEDGKIKDRPNRFGETALRADITAEEILLEYFTVWANAEGIKCYFRGEELGEGFVGKEDGEPWSVVMDGLDGSANYLKGSGWTYGTMVAVAKGESPTYEDFEVAGVLLPEEGWIIRGIKNVGVIIKTSEDKTITLSKFEPEEFEPSKILADDYFQEAKKLLGAKVGVWPRTGSTAASVAALAIGKSLEDRKFPTMNVGWQALVDVTRKGNLEQPIVYRIITELGGVMVDEAGESIGNRDFKTWGQDRKLPIITAKNLSIVEGILKELESS